jgi:hypothetical protein
LKRNTIWPKQDFAVVPLTTAAENLVLSAIGGNPPKKLIHIQIERAGVLEFGAYDNFQSVLLGPGINPEFVTSLTTRGIITSD